ncbi:MAG: hypothetical protein JNL52_03110 [Flavobacteriales bacterium]|nr:hypothetical protein [Flavobacteriales bacterium]
MTTSRNKRIAAAALAALLLADILFPTAMYALSTGPTQPEVQGFTPASATNMVDLFTGDVSYNIPLLDVEGYPVNLAYSGGIGMEQEASWVGLGWNLSPGQVERNMRGIPDDFRGDEIVRTMNLRPNRTFGVDHGIGLQLFSVGPLGTGLSVGSPSFNNYTLMSFELGLNMSIRSAQGNKPSYCAALGFSSTANSGLRLQPSVGFDAGQIRHNKMSSSAAMNFGMTIDSRQGLTNMTLSGTVTSRRATDEQKNQNNRPSKESSADNATPRLRTTDARINIGTSYNYGSPTYSPQIGIPMRNTSVSFSFTSGGAVNGAHPNLTLGAFYSEQRLASPVQRTPAYGFIHHDAGQYRADAQLDFNREKDGPYSGDRPALGIANVTNDFFTVSGQAVSGNYRAYRGDVGHVNDPLVTSGGGGGSLGLDVGMGLLAHGGARVMVNTSNSSSGPWNGTSNEAGKRLSYRSLADKPHLERVYFREANEPTVEQDSSLWKELMADTAVRFELPEQSAFANRLGTTVTDGERKRTIPTTNYRTKREPRAQLFTYLDHATATNFGLVPPIAHGAYTPPGHHMSEVTVVDKQGGRHVYGIPAYNMTQVEVEFNVSPVSVEDGMVGYSTAENSTANERGRDHFYSRTETPAYAYAFLLTAVLSHDYSDVDGEQGPSDGDLGNYTKFDYVRKHENFPWRTPAPADQSHRGRYIKGRPAVDHDDKCTYVYGTKEVYYLKKIETKNYIAVFHLDSDPGLTSPDLRKDSKGVSEHGTITGASTSKLDSISLYEKSSYLFADTNNLPLPAPIKRVHFRYDYSLCPGTPTSADVSKGKLTLKRVFFTYGVSRMGVTAPYLFDYTGVNPPYSPVKQDRWGMYKPAGSSSNEDYPYADQNPVTANTHASAWQLTSIRLPSGGTIHLQYESDDYGYVEDRRAMRMFQLDGFTASNSVESNGSQDKLIVDNFPSDPLSNNVLWINRPPDVAPQDIGQLFEGVEDLYFRVKVIVDPQDPIPGYTGEYVSGYANFDVNNVGLSSSGDKIYIQLQNVLIDEGVGYWTNPIFRATMQYVRLNYPEEIANSTIPGIANEQSVTLSFLTAAAGAVGNLVTGFLDLLTGPNRSLHRIKPLIGTTVVLGQSWIKLNDPDHKKLGGGYRVAQINFNDEWQSMESSETDRSYSYTQHYTYGDVNGSWGVAGFEPAIGADEIPHRKPAPYTEDRALSPDERFYMEEPFGESMFPSAVVGYARVEVTDVVPESVRAAQGTGRVVHEFHTARDFPTIVRRTTVDPQRRQNNNNILSFLGLRKIDHMHASQGFVVETNDMHGKPKRTAAYPEGSNIAVSYVEYNYRTKPYGNAKRLDNVETTIDPSGAVSRNTIGRDYEFFADTREFSSRSYSGGADIKFELLFAAIAAIPVPLYLPQVSWESTRFKTGVMVKKIHRFGRIHEVVKMENGSRVSTENLAYDALTGQVLLTRTSNNFKDPIYTISFPAYWHYDGMGLAYRNIGATIHATVNASGQFTHPQAHELFVPGDELALVPNDNAPPIKAWVDARADNTVTLLQRTQQPVPAGTYRIMVLRSGRRNMAEAPMMEMTTLRNPLDGLTGNLYREIINASALEYGQEWTTECLCLDGPEDGPPLNRWVLNQRGVWRLSKENVWLTERTRSVANNNSNIRRDGVYTAYDPFYKVQNGQWSKDLTGWTTTRTVTHYSNAGQELENKDALGLYSAVNIGYKGTLVKSVARNAKYQETGFDGFEETTPVNCADQHFRLYGGPGSIMDGIAHSGRRSLKVTSTTPVSLVRTNTTCDPGGCTLQLRLHAGELTITGAQGNVTLSSTPVHGSPLLVPGPSGWQVTGTTPWTIMIVATDAAGCTVQQQFNWDE